MTVATKFYDWQRSTLDWNAAPYESCSPNLILIRNHLLATWGGESLGCEGDRPVRLGVLPSSHSYGAANDWRWEWYVGSPKPKSSYIARPVLDTEVLPFLIDNSAELGIQAVHDEGRIWRAWRPPPAGGPGWKTYPTGYDGWLHIETHVDSFSWSTPIAQRFPPDPPPPEEDDVSKPINVIKPADGWMTDYDDGNGPATFIRYGSGNVFRAVANDEAVAVDLGAAVGTHSSKDWYNELLNQSGSTLPPM